MNRPLPANAGGSGTCTAGEIGSIATPCDADFDDVVDACEPSLTLVPEPLAAWGLAAGVLMLRGLERRRRTTH